MSESRIRLVDLDEHDLVITVRTRGSAEVELNSEACAATAADLLRHIAQRLDEQHSTATCKAPERDESAEAAPAEDLAPMMARGGSLNGDRWTDGNGHTWDLSLTWIDGCRQRWQWAGWFDRGGAPMMRDTVGGTQMPLDTVRVVFGGPMRPAAGGQR